jgi:RHS repeat-associated protein
MTGEGKHLALAERVEARTGLAAWPGGSPLGFDATGAAQRTIADGRSEDVLSKNRGNRYGFTARELDSVTGLQYNRARWYDPKTGRWTSQDPLGFDAGDANWYRYVRNDPSNATDPTGFKPIEWKGKVGENWGDKDNWDPPQVPTAIDDVRITSQKPVSVNVPAEARSLVFMNDNCTLEVNQNLTVHSEAVVSGDGTVKPHQSITIARGATFKIATTKLGKLLNNHSGDSLKLNGGTLEASLVTKGELVVKDASKVKGDVANLEGNIDINPGASLDIGGSFRTTKGQLKLTCDVVQQGNQRDKQGKPIYKIFYSQVHAKGPVDITDTWLKVFFETNAQPGIAWEFAFPEKTVWVGVSSDTSLKGKFNPASEEKWDLNGGMWRNFELQYKPNAVVFALNVLVYY